MTVSKVIHRLKSWLSYQSNQRRFLNKTSDSKRWSKGINLRPDWNERTEILAKKITKDSRVFEFGAGTLYLETLLPQGCTYSHSDISKRNDKTLVADLNKEIPDIPEVDYIVFSGVLEYIFDVNTLLQSLNPKTKFFLLSYASTDAYPNVRNRRLNGWVSDLSNQDLNDIFQELELEILHLGQWRKQELYLLTKI